MRWFYISSPMRLTISGNRFVFRAIWYVLWIV